jgi:hypothetical protein
MIGFVLDTCHFVNNISVVQNTIKVVNIYPCMARTFQKWVAKVVKEIRMTGKYEGQNCC